MITNPDSSLNSGPGQPSGLSRVQRRMIQRQDVQKLAQLAKDFFRQDAYLDDPQNPGQAETPFANPLFNAVLAYHLCNNWDELLTSDETRMLYFIDKIRLIPSLQTLLQQQGIPEPQHLKMRVSRFVMIVKLQTS
jgi:hypothetical protein